MDLFLSRVNKRNSSEPLREGDLVELECVAYNSKPPANISWFNGAEQIEQLPSVDSPLGQVPANLGGAGAGAGGRSQRQRRLLQRNQVTRNSDGLTYNTHSFLSIKLSRHEHRAQISCQARQAAEASEVGGWLPAMSKSLELQVQRKWPISSFHPSLDLRSLTFSPSHQHHLILALHLFARGRNRRANCANGTGGRNFCQRIQRRRPGALFLAVGAR